MLTHNRQSPLAPRPRRGFTILEFLVVFTMLSVVGGAVTMVLMRQQRFYTNTSALTENRAQLRQALNVMPLDLWSASSVGGDVYAMTDSSIDFRAITGASVVCVNNTNSSYIVLPPVKLAKGTTLTAWVNKPVVGDSILVYNDSTSSATARDDRWDKFEITAVDTIIGNISGGCTTASFYTQVADLVPGNPSYQLKLSPLQSKRILSGAPVRIFRRVRYSLFKDTDNKWYLGYYDCLKGRTPVCTATKPVSGPFQPYALPSAGTSGLTFTYYDSTGAATADRFKVARMNVIVRAVPEFAMTDNFYAANAFQDSLRFDIALRNRK
jgi:type II secretory pathway pseudopilin PulG